MDNREQKLVEELAKDDPMYWRYLESLSNEELSLELKDHKEDRFPHSDMTPPEPCHGFILSICAERGLMEGPLS